MVCEICGGEDIIKEGGIFVCHTCGGKYSLEEVKKLIKEMPDASAEVLETEENKTADKEEEKKGKNVKPKKKGLAKRIILSLVAVILVAAIGFGGYFYIENEKKYDEYISNAKLYITKIESAIDKIEAVALVRNANLALAFSGGGNGSNDLMEELGLKTEEAEAAERLRSEAASLGYKLRNPKDIYFHEDISEIKRLAKVIHDDFEDLSSSVLSVNNLFSASSLNYDRYKADVLSGIKKLKNLVY